MSAAAIDGYDCDDPYGCSADNDAILNFVLTAGLILGAVAAVIFAIAWVRMIVKDSVTRAKDRRDPERRPLRILTENMRGYPLSDALKPFGLNPAMDFPAGQAPPETVIDQLSRISTKDLCEMVSGTWTFSDDGWNSSTISRVITKILGPRHPQRGVSNRVYAYLAREELYRRLSPTSLSDSRLIDTTAAARGDLPAGPAPIEDTATMEFGSLRSGIRRLPTVWDVYLALVAAESEDEDALNRQLRQGNVGRTRGEEAITPLRQELVARMRLLSNRTAGDVWPALPEMPSRAAPNTVT